ncbi:hypothetical protein [Pseudomonas azotoformans]|uniref:hypothetical protein n=1 Tax=Pseudomonas azotoformans TaxID=47878 RepID=UPI00098F1B08|nr:hypothetical protein [Pseudomonas azotoformans]AQT93859.1 hypothetical protein B1R45_11505 [Pseudomonas azotoformans]UMY51628.1 hypothetical protein MLC69_11455 [Pseudomonas azotoformans]
MMDYRGAPHSVVAREFAGAYPYFQGESGFVTRDVLQHAANRPLTGNPVDDPMTRLAREILSRPGMSSLLDGVNHGGHQDGLISLGDAHAAVDMYEADESSRLRNEPMAYNAGARGGYERYSGGMQRYRVENGYGESGAYTRHPVFDNRAIGQPFSRGAYEPSYDGRMSPQNNALANDFKCAKYSDLATELGNNFDYFKPNEHSKITQNSLREVAGRPLTGNPVDDRMTLLGREILSRPDLNRKLDSDHDVDKSDGLIGRDTIERLSSRKAEPNYEQMNDVELLEAVKGKFKQYWGRDDYISFDSLEKAAAESPPTDRTRLAAALLHRPGLMKELDIGTKGNGRRGDEDQRFDRVNVDYVIAEKKAHSSRA